MKYAAELCALARRHRVAAVVFPLLATVFLFDVLVLDRSLSGFDIILSQPNWQAQFGERGAPNRMLADSPTAHYPQRRVYWELQRRGQTANYNPYIFSGVPASGQGVGAFLSSLPQLWLDTPDAVDWSTWVRLVLAGLFMYALLLRLGTGRACALFGAVAWTYNLHQIVWLEFPQHLATQLWLPLLLLLNLRALDTGFRREPVIALLVVNVLFYTSGYTQIVLYGYLFVVAFNSVYLLFDPARGGDAKLRAWLLMHGVYLLGGAVLSATIWFDTREISEGLRGVQTFRSGVGTIDLSLGAALESVRNALPRLGDLIRLLAPNYYGGLWDVPYRGGPHGNLVEGGAYFGTIVLACIPFAAMSWRSTDGRHLLLSLLVPLVLFMAMEHRDPIVLWLINRVPFIGFGHYGRSITLIVFLCCVLAAMGLNQLQALLARGAYRGAMIGIGAVALVPIAIKVLNPALVLHRFTFSWAVLAVAGVAIVVLVRHARLTLIAPALTAITVVELFAVTYTFNTRLPNELIFPVNRTIQRLIQDRDVFRVAVVGDQYLYRPNVLAYYGLPAVDGYSTLVPNRYLRFARETFGPSKVTANGILYLRAPNVSVLRALNVKYVISDRPLELRPLELVDSHSGEWIYRIRGFLPRVYCADFATDAPATEQAATFMALLDKYRRPLVATAPLPYSGHLSGSCSPRELRVYTNGLSAEIDATAATYAVLAVGFSDHWNLRVDGHQVEPMRVNANLLATPLSAGVHRIELRFRNTALSVSAVLLTMLGLVAVFVGWRRRSLVGLVLAITGALLIAKNSLTVYPLRNDRIPEKALSAIVATSLGTPGVAPDEAR